MLKYWLGAFDQSPRVEVFGHCRDRGYADMERMLESKLERLHGVSPRGEAIARAIRERELSGVRSLLDASPELLHVGDQRSKNLAYFQ